MITDGPQDHHILPITLPQVDLFRLGQGFSGIATPPHTPPGRSDTYVDMVSAHYLSPGPHHTDRLQVDGLLDSTSCSSGHSTGAYTTPELDPYSAVCPREGPLLPHVAFQSSSGSPFRQASGVSSFNYPATADSSLLTPVSSAGSPPLQQRPAAKTMQSYHQTQGAISGVQVPTPPNTSKLYYSSYDINASSQGSSPMTVHPQVTEAPAFDMGSYIAHSPPGGHHPSSPKAEVPPPIDPYLGHFTVSGASESEVTHHPFPGYPQFSNVDQDMFNRQQQSPHIPVTTAPLHQHRMHSPAPIMAPSHQTHYRPDSARIEDLRDPMMIGSYQSQLPGKRPAPRPKRPPPKKPSRPSKATFHAGSMDSQAYGDDEDREELTLRDDAPEDDKYLFQLRKEFLSEKGKGMWEEMKAKYSEKHQGSWEKAALQMKVSRAVAKFGVWPKREVSQKTPFGACPNAT